MRVKILDLRPTQMALGIREVDHKVKKIGSLKEKELLEFLADHRIPVVLGPESRIFLVDHHHLARACWESGITEIPVEKLADLSHLTFKELWKAMEASHWLHPFDQFGNGPHDPIHLPENIKGLADDPYRSLAWLVREKGGFEKSKEPFAEFQWAGFFRKKLKSHPTFHSYDDALTEALRLAASPDAHAMPGYISKR